MRKKLQKDFIFLIAVILTVSFFPASLCFAADNAPVPASVTEGMFTKRDYNTSYNDYTPIDLDSAASDIITVSRPGCYLLSGTLADGQLVINVENDEKVQLVLDNASLTCHNAAAIYIASADKVFITTVKDSVNSVASYAELTDADIDAAIYSQCDLTFNGSGLLAVSCPRGHAVATKDDLRITSGKYELSAGKQGLNGKDSIRIAGGEISIGASRDGMHSEHRKSEKGFIYICGGNINISAGRDGIYASNYIVITDGQLKILSGNGSSDTADGKTAPSCKGVCSDTAITVYGGKTEVTTFDDALHSKGDINILGGYAILCSGKEAIDGEARVNIVEGTTEERIYSGK